VEARGAQANAARKVRGHESDLKEPDASKEKMKMAFEQRDNSGSLWVNDRKSEESHPDRTGTVMIGGRLNHDDARR
jgi:hypothetical protein